MKSRFDLLDYLRFLAALSVMFYHYFFNGISVGKVQSIDSFYPLSLWARYGFLGVALFFLISGFVIYHSALNKTAAQFAVGRMVRLFPMFWIGVAFTTLFSLMWDADAKSVSLKQFAVNLTMVSRAFGVPFVDDVYWSLNYELTFYAVVFGLILAGLSDKLHKIFKIWAFAMLAYYAVEPFLPCCEIAPLRGYFTFFIGGALFASIQRNGWTLARFAACAAAFWLCVDFILDRLPGLEAKHHTDLSDGVIVAAVSSFFVVFCLLTFKQIAALRLPYATFLGGLTYPLYLIHARFGYLALSRYGHESNKWLVVASLILGVLVFSAIMLNVDKVLKKYWTALFDISIGAPLRRLEKLKSDHLPSLCFVRSGSGE